MRAAQSPAMPMRALIAVLLVCLACIARPGVAAPVALTRAQAVQGDAPHFPGDANAPIVDLPDDWLRTRPRYEGVVWYRLSLDRPEGASDELFALYIERACSTVDVWLNGYLVHSAGSREHPNPRDCIQPHLIPLPASLLMERANVVDLRVHGVSTQQVGSRQEIGGLSAMRLGTLRELSSVREVREFLTIDIVRVLCAPIVLLGIYMLYLYRTNRNEVVLLYFGALLIGWTLLSARSWWPGHWLDEATIEFLIACLYAPVLGCAVQFLLSYAGLRSRVIEAMLLLQCVLLPVSLLVAGAGRFFLMASAWQGVISIELCMAVGLYLVIGWRHHREDFRVMLPILLGVLVTALYQLAAQFQLAILPTPSAMHIAMPMLLLAIGARLMHRFARALQAVEAMRLTVDERVRDATYAAEREFEQRAEARVEQVTQNERKRIAADLHDDLGAKLLTIVHTSESERIATLAREALEEMRLSVRGLTGKPVRLSDALADWRNEVVSRLGQANIEADWRGLSEDTDKVLNARAYVQSTRIFREAVSNIIKHSGASLCQIESSVGENDFLVTIQDNGKGIPMELDGKLDRGHGMSSMKHRAKQLQGQCLVESGPGYGTVIRLTLPL